MNSSTINLMDMPDEVFDRIFEKCRFREIRSLRKVCSKLRNYIDSTKPDANLIEIEVVINSNEIVTYYYGEVTTDRIGYEDFKRGCLMESRQKINWHNGNFIEMSLGDLMSNMKFQKSVLKEFRIIYRTTPPFPPKTLEKAVKTLELSLKSLNPPIKTERYYLEPFHKNQLTSSLPYFDAEVLKLIEVFNREDIEGNDVIIEMDQWKKAGSVDTSRAVVFKDVEDFRHLNSAVAWFEEFKLEDLKVLKGTFFQNPSFTQFHFTYKTPINWTLLENILGEPFETDEYYFSNGQKTIEKLWFFEENGIFLEISKDKYPGIVFRRVEEKRIPRTARIEKFVNF